MANEKEDLVPLAYPPKFNNPITDLFRLWFLYPGEVAWHTGEMQMIVNKMEGRKRQL